jgi:hypothetical protein
MDHSEVLEKQGDCELNRQGRRTGDCARRAPPKPVRLLVQYEGCDGLDSEEPEADVDESDLNTVVLTVRYVDLPRPEDR